jgi:hypothetical protein
VVSGCLVMPKRVCVQKFVAIRRGQVLLANNQTETFLGAAWHAACNHTSNVFDRSLLRNVSDELKL